MPLALSDNHLPTVMAAAGSLPVERRPAFLESVAKELRGCVTDSALGVAVHEALRDLMQAPAA